MQIENVAIDKLIQYEFNNKIHDVTQIDRIANSIKEFGFLQPLVIEKDNTIIVGHGRYLGAKKLGLKKLPCVRVENLTDEQIKKYRILDNRLNESAYNMENLKVELEELDNFNIGDLEISIDELFPDLEIIGPDGFGDEFSLPSGGKATVGQMKFILADEQKELIEQAIKDVKETDLYKSQMNYGNENSNGNALYCIVSQWMELNQ